MSKVKRKVTVETGKSAPEDSDGRRKPSVFERLGPGTAPQRRSYAEDSNSDREDRYVKRCRNWLMTGDCPYGATCKFQHGPYAVSVKTKGKRDDETAENVHMKVKRHKHKTDEKHSSDTEDMAKSQGKERDGRIKSAVIVKKPGGHESGSESDSSWSGDDLDFKKELELEKKRQQIQRELSRLEETESEERENFVIQKRVEPSSEEGSNEERGRSKTKKSAKGSPSKKKLEKKKAKASKSPAKSKTPKTPSPSPKPSDDKFESEEKDIGHHKGKHKKKSKGSGGKKRHDSLSDEGKAPDVEKISQKLLSPLKFKKKQVAQMLRTITAFNSEEEESPVPEPKVVKKEKSRSPSWSEGERSRSQKSHTPTGKDKRKRSLTPEVKVHVSKKKIKGSPVKVREQSKEPKHSRDKNKGSISPESNRGRSASPPERQTKKEKKLLKKMKKKDLISAKKKEPSIERKRETGQVREEVYERLEKEEGKGREATPMSEYSRGRDFSPGPEPVKKKKDKKNKKKNLKEKESFGSKDQFDTEVKASKKGHKERGRSLTSQREEEIVRTVDRNLRKDADDRGRSPEKVVSRDLYADRRGKSPYASYRPEERSPQRFRDSEASPHSQPRKDHRDQRDVREDRDRDYVRNREDDQYRKSGQRPSPMDRDPRGAQGMSNQQRGDNDRRLQNMPPGTDRHGIERYSQRDFRGAERERHEEDRHRGGRDQSQHDEQARYDREQDRSRERVPWGRNDREAMVRDHYGRGGYQHGMGDPRYNEGHQRGPPPPFDNFRDPSWDRGRGRGRGRGSPLEGHRGQDRFRGRGKRFDERSGRRGDWENHQRDEFFMMERRDWPDHRDDRRDLSREDIRERHRDIRMEEIARDEREREDRKVDVRGRDDSQSRRRYDAEELRGRRDDSENRSRDSRGIDDRKYQDDPRRDQRDRKDQVERERDRERNQGKVDERDQKARFTKKKKSSDSHSQISEGDGGSEDEQDRKYGSDDEAVNRGDKKKTSSRSRKRLASEGSRSPSRKKARENSPGSSVKSHVSEKPSHQGSSHSCSVEDRERLSDRLSDAKSEETGKVDSVKSDKPKRNVKGKVEQKGIKEKRTREVIDKQQDEMKDKKSDQRSLGERRKRSRSRSQDHSDSEDYKRKKADRSPKNVKDVGKAEKDKEVSPKLVVGEVSEEKGPDTKDKAGEKEPIPEETGSLHERSFQFDKEEFSDWSENDSADEILNKMDEASPEKPTSTEPFHWERERMRRSPSRSSHGSRKSRGSHKSHISAVSKELLHGLEDRASIKSGKSGKEKPQEERSRTGSIGAKSLDKTDQQVDDENESLSYEAISSEEGSLLGDEETAYSKQKQKVAVDALDLDWTSLLQDNRPKPSAGSGRKRFTPASIFAKIGISKQYAGEAIFNLMISACQKQLEEEKEQQSTASGENAKITQEEKEEAEKERDETVEVKPSFGFQHDIPAFHSAALQKMKERQQLLQNVGPYRKALVARHDLEIRRQLCKVDKVVEQPSVYPTQQLDTDLFKLGVQLFKQARNQSERHEKAAVIKAEILCSS
ncbi:hypothetical protein ACJMK2_018180 [Sinanodonta woodiana]|uniref:C3H1-type domain-containing protein n=1 Tax=Sinanodonta woodiana TaxID=1069815 RepID=A0ABD3UCM2_SINWO